MMRANSDSPWSPWQFHTRPYRRPRENNKVISDVPQNSANATAMTHKKCRQVQCSTVTSVDIGRKGGTNDVPQVRNVVDVCSLYVSVNQFYGL